MRPSDKPNEIAVLDTLNECRVVLDALEDSDIPHPAIGPSDDDFANSLGVRFRRQAMHEPRPPAADAFVEDVFNLKPEFNVLRDDAHFVIKAAERVLAQKEVSSRVFNRLTGRTKAAKEMIRVLAAKLY